jgi:CBS domain-containing protein
MSSVAWEADAWNDVASYRVLGTRKGHSAVPATGAGPSRFCAARSEKDIALEPSISAVRIAQGGNMLVSEVMSRGVQVAWLDQTIQEAARMMSDMDVGALPVAQEDRLVGMITDRDIAVRAVAENEAPSTKVRDVMTQDTKILLR